MQVELVRPLRVGGRTVSPGEVVDMDAESAGVLIAKGFAREANAKLVPGTGTRRAKARKDGE